MRRDRRAESRRRLASLTLVLSLFAHGARVQAQQGEAPLAGDDFAIDLVTGPIVGSGRIVGLAGAYSALAFGIDGAAFTPAAYASRSSWELAWFEWDLTADYSPGTFRDTDFDNDGRAGFTYRNFSFLTLGARFTFGALGLGALIRMQEYRLGPDTDLSLATTNFGAGYAFLDGQLLVGLGGRTATLSITDRTNDTSLVDFAGTGPEVGVVVAPVRAQFRIGASARLAVSSSKTRMVRVAAGLTLPREIVLPAEAQLGFAYQLGPRPLNRRFENPRDQEDAMRAAMLAARAARVREQARREAQAPSATMDEDETLVVAPRDPEFWAEEEHLRQAEERALEAALERAEAAREAAVRALSRRYILLSAEAIFIGAVDNAVGLESFLRQTRQISGDGLSVGMRAGAEGEPIAGRLRVRLGSYLEPSRFASAGYRPHGTLGFDLRLFSWDLFGLLDEFDLRMGASFDLAARYSNLGLGVGVWH